MGSTVWLMLGTLLGCGGGIPLERYIHGEEAAAASDRPRSQNSKK